jgi:hypothetical protein
MKITLKHFYLVRKVWMRRVAHLLSHRENGAVDNVSKLFFVVTNGEAE